MRLRFTALLILVAVVVSLTGCAKLIDTKEEVVEATIVDAYYKGAWVQMIMSGKTMIPISHPAEYWVKLQYGEITTSFNSYDLYSICHGKNGATLQCTLITESYDDGSVKQFLEWRK